MSYKLLLEHILKRAGIAINGSYPGDMQVADNRVFSEIFWRGSLGLGEAYMRGWWTSNRVDIFIYKILKAKLDKLALINPATISYSFKNLLTDSASKTGSFDIGDAHYNKGDDLFIAMLDQRLTYTCGYWTPGVKNLDQAQEAKLDLICRKLGLTPVFHLPIEQRPIILDIGCGWGSFAKFAAQKYGVRVVGITVSEEQIPLGKKLCQGLPVEFRFQDYRDVNEKFDHIVSVGMFEHVEPQHYNEYFEMAKRCLKPNGLFLLHTIGKRSGWQMDPWIHKYIFPVGVVPREKQIVRASKNYFTQLDWHKFGGEHYDQTLMAWHANFQKHWPQLKAKYADKINGQFKRMWDYYLLFCAGGFRSQELDLWQIVFAHKQRNYQAIR